MKLVRRLARRLRSGEETGSIPLERAILAPAGLLIISVVIFAGRVALAHQSLDGAAASAAREASISRTQPAANSAATAAAAQTLTQQGLDCATTSVSVDTTGFASPAGTPATISATVTCVVPLADLAIPGIPGSMTITGNASSPLDTYRER